jgi:hypothetical protein
MNSARRSGHVVDTFHPTKTYLIALLNDIHHGRTKLPNFQRSWRPSDDHITGLLASIGEGDYVGSATLAEADARLGFTYRCLDGVRTAESETTVPDNMIVDGQQRLTALYQACYSDRPVRAVLDQSDAYRLYFFDIRKAISTANSLKDAVISLAVDADGSPLDGSCDDFTDPAVQFAKGVFPINRMFRFDEWEAANRSFWDRPELAMRRSEALDLVDAFRDGIVNSFGGYIFPVVMLERSILPDRICRIYENLNSSEMRLATLGDLDGPGSAT